MKLKKHKEFFIAMGIIFLVVVLIKLFEVFVLKIY